MGRARVNEPPMPEPLAYFLTWSTYGAWLPGDERGWTEYAHGWQLPDPVRKLAAALMTEDACRLDREQRDMVERQITQTCRIRGWELHAVNCRSNHVHVVVTADQPPKIVRNQLKAWCTRRLNELEIERSKRARSVSEDSADSADSADPRSRFGLVLAIRENWWAERGSQRFINDAASLEAAILYVRDGQDIPRPH